jgi:DNA-binding CsgD family transcriptional regulator/tetratricopeptide (TPR) repeat protein
MVTYRDSEVAGEYLLRQAIGDLVTSSSTVWMGLSPLTRAGVRSLAGATGSSGDALYERTGGNPFFVTEVLASPEDDVPTSIRLAVLARTARLDPSARSVLDAVSIVPGRVERWLIAAISERPDSGIDTCVAAGVLTTDGGSVEFRHELARRAVEEDLATGTRRTLNQRAADALNSRPGSDPARIAHHAEHAGDDQMLAASARVAFLVAASRTGHREAARHAERALSVPQFLSDDQVADLQMKLASSLIALARCEQAVVLAHEAIDHWRSGDDDLHEAEALLVLSSALVTLGRTARAMEPLGRAIELLERREPGRQLAAAYMRLASVHMLARERDPAVEWGERAIALASQHDDPALLGRALIVAGIADVMSGQFDGLARVRSGIELGRRHDLPEVVVHGFTQIGSGCGELRRYDQAMPALIEGLGLATTHSFETHRRYQTAWLARCRFDLGQWDEAEALARDAMTGSATDVMARFVGLNTLGWLRARRGEADVFPLLDEALVVARESSHLQRLWPNAIARAEAGWLDGTLESHLALLEEVYELAMQLGHRLAIGEISVWLQRAGSLPVSMVGAAQPFDSWIAGDLMVASAGFRSMGCPYESASVLADTGEVSSLREAWATFQRLGAAPMASRVEAQLHALGVRVSPSVAARKESPNRASGLTDREVEVLRLVAAGFTNPQIATTLYISRKTAEHHVSNILMKLGASTRAQAAAAAIRLGIAG